MKTIFNLKKSIFVVALLLGTTVSMTSCGDDDDNNTTTEVKVGDEKGTYNGKLVIAATTPERAAADDGITLSDVKLDKDTVWFDKFPVEDIVNAVVADEEAAKAAIAAIGDKAYKVGYTATQNTEKNGLNLVATPKPLELTYTIASEVEGEEGTAYTIVATFSGKTGAKYASKKVNFVLELTDAKMKDGQTPEGFKSKAYSFELTKK